MSVRIVDRMEQRCRQLLKSHKERAKTEGQSIDYGIEDIRRLVEERKQCHYCGMPLTFDLQLDHMVPQGRCANAHRLANIIPCCSRCNQIKGGKMTAAEYLNLLDYLGGLHPSVSDDVLARLRAGGKARYAGRRRRKGG